MECPRYAKITEEQLAEIRTLEKKLNLVLVAYEKMPAYKKLTPGELARIRELENETGSILVAYEA